MLTLVSLMLLLPGAGQSAEEAVLHGFSYDAETVTIAVSTCGCTLEEDFVFLLKSKPKVARDVTVIRLQPDTCAGDQHGAYDEVRLKGVPQLVEFIYSRKDLKLKGAKRINVINVFEPFTESAAACGQ